MVLGGYNTTSGAAISVLDKVQKIKMKKQYILKYSIRWEKHKEFKNWLIRDPDNSEIPYCSYCKKSIKGNITSLRRHNDTDAHKETVKILQDKLQPSLASPTVFPESTRSQHNIKEQTKKLELALCVFLAKKNLPFSLMTDPDRNRCANSRPGAFTWDARDWSLQIRARSRLIELCWLDRENFTAGRCRAN